VSEPDCSEALRELHGFLDGELTVEVRATIAHHLDACSHCLEAFDFEAELKMLVARRCTESPPPGLRERIASALRAGDQEPPAPA
jgi:mycothiol system anti-sigma-R factor